MKIEIDFCYFSKRKILTQNVNIITYGSLASWENWAAGCWLGFGGAKEMKKMIGRKYVII